MVWICEKLELPDPEIKPVPATDSVEAEVDRYLEHLLQQWAKPLTEVRVINDNFSKETWKNAGHLERVNLEDILDKIAPLVPDFSREAAVDTLDKLVTGEILTEKNLNYCFTVNMTRKWIASRHPLRKVRG